MDEKLFETRMVVKPEWIDHNGHMNVAFYVLAFDEATDAVYEQWGIGLDYPDRGKCSVFTIGMNVDYLGELFEGDAIVVKTQLVDLDGKRLHYFHEMYHEASGRLSATNECLVMNVSLESRRSAPFPPLVREELERVWEMQKELKRPSRFSRTLEIRHK